MRSNFLDSTLKQFAYYKLLGDRTFDQLSDEALFDRPNPTSNSIAVIIKHLSGNMSSRWTDFLTEDGEKEWRDRDREFIDDFGSRDELLELWETGWQCVFDAINGLKESDLENIVYIRNMGHTVVEAINRQLTHYAYHIGQIVFLGKMHVGASWDSLTIPIGQSEVYNKEKFARKRHREFYLDEHQKKKSRHP